MGNNNEDAAPGPTDTTTGSAEGDTTGPSQAETISRLQDELLEAAGSNAAEVTNLISEIRRISPEAAICRTAPRGETPLHKVMDNKEATDDIIAEILKAMTEEEINRADGHGWSALGRAAWDNRVDFARTLLAAGADIACCAHARYGPPLNCAVLFGHIEVARAICEHAGENGVDIDKRNLIGFTPLHTACRNDATEMVDLLLDHGADMNLACEAMLNVSPLDLAVRKGSEGTVRVLIRHGARIQDRTASGWTPLFTAVFRTDDKLVRMLLDLGADVNGTSEDGRTPLTGAAGKRGLSTVKLLLDRGAHFDKPDASGRTPLGVAACNGTDENVQLFLDLGADINKPSRHGRTPLAVACHRGNLRIVYLLLERKADPRILDSDGHSPLFLASIGGFSGIVAALLATGVVNVDATDAQGRTALHMACLSGTGGERSGRFDLPRADYAQTVDLLTRHGANTELRTAAGETMLHFAAESINVDHIRILLKHMRQADILATTPSGKTALDISIGRRTRKVAALLLSTSVCGIPPEAIDEATLRWAAEDESTHKIVQMKLKRDADRESRLAEIKSHWSALDVAAYLGQYVLVQQLLRGLSPSRDRIERIEHAISVLDAANSTPRVMGMTSAMEDSSDRNEKEDTQMNNEELQDPAKLEPFSETVSHRYMAVKALLKVAGSSARTSNMVIELQLPTTVVEVKRRHEASIFDFYSGGTVSTVSRKVAPVHNVIYTQGPQAIMDVQRRFDEKARSMVEAMEWPKDDDSVALRTEALAELVPGHDKDLILRWVHLPANNMKWMQDLTTRIRYDRAPNPSYEDMWSNPRFFGMAKKRLEIRDDPSFPDLKSFFGNSWVEFPDASSPSRAMKAKCVRKETRAPGNEGPVRETSCAGKNRAAGDTKSREQSAATRSDVDFQPLALYMPYLTFATQDNSMTNSMKPFADESQIIHGSRTLDEYHYQFASDKDFEQDDIDKRNRDQVVTRWLHRDEDVNNLESWVVLRVDQLWLWIIAPDVIITSSTHRLDGRPDVVANSVFTHLQKGNSQPKTVHELADLITSTCIQFYDQMQETTPGKSTPEEMQLEMPKSAGPRENVGLTVQEIFSNAINKVAIEEVELFETFTKDEEVTNDRKSAVPTTKKVTVVKPARLLCEVKDLQDEINILRAIVTQQQRVQEAFLGEQKGEAGMTGQIIARIDEMDKYAARIYSAVHATLGLEQNKIAIGYSNETVRQGRNLMAFTATTILFLPLSFLSSLFALDVSVFPHNEKGDVAYSPQWVFPLIFCISATFWAMVILYAFQDQMMAILQLHRFRDMGKWGKEIMSRRQEKASELAEPSTPGLKPRGLQKLGLRWRKPRQVFEEDGLSLHSINGERKPKSPAKK